MDTRSVKTAPPRDLGRDELAAAVEWYGKMVLARRFEEEAEREFRRGKIGGYLHVYSGQEAVAAGFLSAIRPEDIFFTAYRDHAHALFRGAAPGAVMAELFGKATGLAKGKGGSMHLFDVARGFYGGYGIVGGHIPLATGAAFALRYQQADRICLCFLGDGAMNSGSFTNRLIWLGSGASRVCARSSISLRTTSMRWAHRWIDHPRSRTWPAGSRCMRLKTNAPTGWISSRSAGWPGVRCGGRAGPAGPTRGEC